MRPNGLGSWNSSSSAKAELIGRRKGKIWRVELRLKPVEQPTNFSPLSRKEGKRKEKKRHGETLASEICTLGICTSKEECIAGVPLVSHVAHFSGLLMRVKKSILLFPFLGY
jgi:hypothetical protein